MVKLRRSAAILAFRIGTFAALFVFHSQANGDDSNEPRLNKSAFAKLLDEHGEGTSGDDKPVSIAPLEVIDALPPDLTTDALEVTGAAPKEPAEQPWDFYKGLQRLSGGVLDFDLLGEGIHAKQIIATDRSHGFNEPVIIVGPAETESFEKSDMPNKPGKLKATANATVEVQADAAFFRQDDNNIATVGEIPDGAFFRRSRIGFFGEVYETVEYRIEYDFANEARPQFLDNWVALTNIPIVNNIIIGHYFEPFSLERYSPNRFITFMERSLADTFAPARNMGAMIYGNALDKRVTYALGAFRSNSNIYGEDVSFNSGYAVTAHATVLAWYEELGEDNLRLLHLGGSYSYRASGDDPVNFSTRPSIRMRQQGVGGVPVFVSTGNLDDASHVQLFGLEAAWVHGPFSIQSEYMAADTHRKRNADPFFHGGYVYGSWFLTGESRSYSPTSILGRFREGIFQRTVPRSNVFDRNAGAGWTGGGAFEVAVRWSYIDLNSAGVMGGYLEDMTYGLNWYLNPYTKVMFNYIRPTLRDPVLGKSKADALGMRVQFEF